MLAAKAPTKGVGGRSVSSSLPQAIAYLSILFRPRSSGASSTAMLIMLARPLMAPILAVHPSDSLTGLASISTPQFPLCRQPLGALRIIDQRGLPIFFSLPSANDAPHGGMGRQPYGLEMSPFSQAPTPSWGVSANPPTLRRRYE